MDPSVPIFDTTKPKGRQMWLPKLAAAVASIGTIGLVTCAFLGNRENTQSILLSVAAAWAILAPVWFFLEFHYFYREAPGKDSWELFKHGQQLAVAVWAGIAATLYAVGNSDVTKPPKKEIECSIVLPAIAKPGAPITTVISCPK